MSSEQPPPTADTRQPPQQEPQHRRGTPRKWTDRAVNFCLDEANASYKCLSDNGYDKAKCEDYFEAYRNCKKEFNKIKAERRRQGLPPLPPARYTNESED